LELLFQLALACLSIEDCKTDAVSISELAQFFKIVLSYIAFEHDKKLSLTKEIKCHKL